MIAIAWRPASSSLAFTIESVYLFSAGPEASKGTIEAMITARAICLEGWHPFMPRLQSVQHLYIEGTALHAVLNVMEQVRPCWC